MAVDARYPWWWTRGFGSAGALMSGGGDSWGTAGRGGNSGLAACSSTGALLRVTILGRVTTSFAEGAHHRGGTGSTATGGPSGRATMIASTAATKLALELSELVLAGLVEGCLS